MECTIINNLINININIIIIITIIINIASFLQIYNETLVDLLSDNNDNLKIREIPLSKKHNDNNNTSSSTTSYEIYVSGLSEYRVQTYNDVMKILATGTTNRTTRTTDFNATSSRSHAILQLTFEIESYENQGHHHHHHHYHHHQQLT